MQKSLRIILGIISVALLIFGLGLWTAGDGQADGEPDRCPSTSKAKCDGLMLKKLGV